MYYVLLEGKVEWLKEPGKRCPYCGYDIYWKDNSAIKVITGICGVECGKIHIYYKKENLWNNI